VFGTGYTAISLRLRDNNAIRIRNQPNMKHGEERNFHENLRTKAKANSNR
jgi:hypothetical protein